MNRRDLLTTATATVSLPSIAGCSSVGNDSTGDTYTLALVDDIDEPSGEVLDFDTAGLAGTQTDIVEAAARTGTYEETNVSWDSLPGRKGITMAFRMVIQLIARHVGRDPTVDGEATFETPSRYDGTLYRAVVDVS